MHVETDAVQLPANAKETRLELGLIASGHVASLDADDVLIQ
jgi:hypothetical protein